jgi:NAD(P)-dependent dehydrogenase (short-subunit alcohol dehydrogenase family)
VDELRFDGRVAVVTGGGRGIGRAHAILLAQRGARVVVNDLGGGPFGGGSSSEPAQKTVAEIRRLGGEAVANDGDVTIAADAAALVELALERFGRLDIVVNNAGIDRFVPFAEMTRALFDEMLAVHLGGSFEVTRAAWPHMLSAGYGRIVMTSSRGAFGLPAQAHYAAAKSGVIGFMRALSLEGKAHGILVNAILPSAWTRLIEATTQDVGIAVPPEGRLPTELVSPAVLWLAHHSCEVTGEALVLRGGSVARVLLAITPGFSDPQLTPELVREHWDEIASEDGYEAPYVEPRWLNVGAKPADPEGG